MIMSQMSAIRAYLGTLR